jgi:putative ABC transport system permease protein
MALPIKYNVSNVLVRWRSTLSTILGIALVVAVYVMVNALAVGLEKNSANTGDPRNLMIVRKGSTAESSSQVTLEQFRAIQYLEGVERDASGKPLASADLLILISLPRRELTGEANVLVRGLGPMGIPLRPQVQLVDGRWFTPGKREVVVARKLAMRFADMNIGDTFKTAGNQLKVVGWFDGQRSAFDSELWMDADEARSIFDRDFFSSVLIRVDNTNRAPQITARIENDKRLPLQAKPEVDYYKSQTGTAVPIKWMGKFLAVAMSIGAIFSAMNTMYASVGARTREVGTLRVLGFRRRTVLLGFILEGAFLALLGGILGCILAFYVNGKTTGTLNFQSFSEVVFEFRITPALILNGLLFSVIVGVLGSLLPALRAARLPVISSLKSV